MSLDLTGLARTDRDNAAGRLEVIETSRAGAALVARHGRTGVAPFLASPDVDTVELVGGAGLSGYARRGRWAVIPGDVVAPEHLIDEALAEFLDVLADRRLRPAFLAVADIEPLQRRGFHVTEIADEAVIDLPSFSLAGSKRANIRHSTTSARRAGLVVKPFEDRYGSQIEEISQEWLRTKRGGELGFTLSRYDEVSAQLLDQSADLWMTVDADDRVQAWCTWRHYLGGLGRVLDVMRRRPHAPNPAMDGLMASVLENYRDVGLRVASLASVPRDHGKLAERVYPTRTLRAYKQKFDPRWETRWLAVPTARHQLFALMAVGRAYCPGGLSRAIRPNR